MGNIFLASGAAYKLEVRQSLIRIPEVIIRLKELQRAMDNNQNSAQFDILNLVVATDYFSLDEKLRSVIDKTIQLGLIDRHLRKNGRKIDVLIGAEGTENLFAVALGNAKVEDLLAQSGWGKDEALINEPIQSSENLVLLKGQASQKFFVYAPSAETSEFKPISETGDSLENIMAKLVDSHKIERLAVIDPVESCESFLRGSVVRERIEIFCTIQSDPFLTWYHKVS